jgi:hypothetical protein
MRAMLPAPMIPNPSWLAMRPVFYRVRKSSGSRFAS